MTWGSNLLSIYRTHIQFSWQHLMASLSFFFIVYCLLLLSSSQTLSVCESCLVSLSVHHQHTVLLLILYNTSSYSVRTSWLLLTLHFCINFGTFMFKKKTRSVGISVELLGITLEDADIHVHVLFKIIIKNM